MKTCFVSRFGGYGDMMHCAHLPKLLKEHYGINQLDWETNHQGYQILQNNMYIDNLIHIDAKKITENRLRNNWDYCKEKYDLCFNLVYTIELEYCLNETDRNFYRNAEYRRKNFGQISYYDVMTKACNLPDKYLGTRGTLFYSDADHASAKEWVAKKKEKYDRLILVNISGSSLHKRFVQHKSIVTKILEKYPKCLVILTGDEHCKGEVWEHERIISWVGKKNFRTVALMTKYLDLTISVETGLPLVAHSWDAPCLQLLTAASFENHVMGAKNAYWLQSPAPCSPCHKNCREYWGCPTKDKMPACVWFSEDEIMKKVEEALGA